MFDYLTGFAPRKLKDLFKWAEYLAFQSAHIYAIVRKFGEYPITRIIYNSHKKTDVEKHKALFDKKLNLKGFLTTVSFDKWIYGNCFVSIYEPFSRQLICRKCHNKYDISVIDYKYNSGRVEFTGQCLSDNCKHNGIMDVNDVKINEGSKIRFIRWDPKLIDIDYNPITGETVYYYTIPRTLMDQVKNGNKTMINKMPYAILKAMASEKHVFKFDEGKIYHLKTPGPAGVEAHWGFPPITSAIKMFLFASVLRKANEAISLEHITPFRVVFPQAAGANADPLTSIPMDRWRREFEQNYNAFRMDPLRIMTAPTPLGVQNIGGDGRAMLTLGELQEAEKNIVLSFGVPMEFLTGGLGQTRGEITLRMIENQLQTHIEDLNGLIQWIEMRCSSFLGWDSIETKLADFKLIDDIENKQLYLQLWGQNKLPDSKIYEILNLDPEKIKAELKEQQINEAKNAMEIQFEVQKIQNSLSNKAQQMALTSQGGINYNDQSAVINAANNIVQELMQYDAGMRRSRLESLQSEDFILYCVVVKQLEQVQQNNMAQAKAQMQNA